MRPPDHLHTLRNTPIVMALAGLLIVPAMWTFLLGPRITLSMAPFTSVVFLLAGVHMTYRSRFSPGEALWGVVIALIFFGSLLVASTTSLVWRMGRPEWHGVALALAAVLAIGGMALGFWGERRRLSPTQDGIPVALEPLIDLERHQIRPLPVDEGPPTMGRIAALSALVLNAPLLLQLNGWQSNDIVWITMPVLGAVVTYVLTTGVGPALARILVLRALERRTGQRFTTSRIDELSAMRRSLWLARWLCRAEDLRPPSPHRTARAATRRRR